MLDGYFIIDPTTHAYNLADANVRDNPFAKEFRKTLWGLHRDWNSPELIMSNEAYFTDWSVDLLVDTLFKETSTDLAAHHYLRLDSWFHDGLCSREKNVEIANRWPDRVMPYLGVDPTAGLDVCLADLRSQKAELPGAIGLKLYPDQVNPLRSWRMDDPKLAYPLFEEAQKLGIRTVAVHKAVPNGPVPLDPYRIGDVDGAAIHFPGLNFEIVHSGLAFTEETALAIARFDNVYANLEITTLLLQRAPGAFEDALALFMRWAGSERIIWSTGCLFCHPEPLLRKFVDFQFSEQMMERQGLKPLSRDDKANILGRNYARLAGIDIEERKARIAGDEFARYQKENGRAAPYAHWRKLAGNRGMIARSDILIALDDVIDPCSIAVGKPIGIASLGLVESCSVEGGDVRLVLCTTGPGCMMIGNLLQAADTRVRSLPGVRDVEITVDTSVMWTPARIRKTESEITGSGKPC